MSGGGLSGGWEKEIRMKSSLLSNMIRSCLFLYVHPLKCNTEDMNYTHTGTCIVLQ